MPPGVTQEDTIYPTIFNVVVDAVIRKCILVVAEEKSKLEGFVWAVKRLATYLYADKGLLAYGQEVTTQQAFDILMGVFD